MSALEEKGRECPVCWGLVTCFQALGWESYLSCFSLRNFLH